MNRLERVLEHPLMVLAGIGIGIAIGVGLPGSIPAMRAISSGYLLLFKMCVAPILISLITAAIARITGLPEPGRLVRGIALAFPGAMLAASLIGLVSALVGGPGRALGSGARSALGAVLGTQHDTLVMPLYAPPITEATPSPVEAFFHSIVPANVFTALASDAALQIIFVAIVFGAAVGTISAARRAVVIDFLEGVFEAFQMILNRLMLFLPLGLIAITAANVGEFNGTTAGAMGRFLVTAVVASLIVVLLSIIVVWRTAGGRFTFAYHELRHPLIVALATQNSFASLPSAIAALHDLGFSDDIAALVSPLAVSVCRIGPVAYIATGAVFVAQLYGIDLTFADLCLIAVGSMIGGLATAGTTGIVQLGMIGVVLALIHVPFDAALVLFVSIDVVGSPLRTLTTVAGGLAAAVLVDRPDRVPEAHVAPAPA